MLCPSCRRQVGKDGYCPQGHLAAPERVVPVEPVFKAPSPPPVPGGPPPLPTDEASTKRRRRPLVMGMVFVLLAAGVLGYLILGSSASAANLRLSFAKDEVHRYALTMTFNVKATSVRYGGMAFNGSMETTLIQRTVDVAKNGDATLVYELGKIRFTERSSTVRLPAQGEILRMRVATDGTVLEAKGKGLLSFAQSDPMADFTNISGPESFGPVLPDYRVDVGKTWSIDQDMANPLGETINFKGSATLVEKRTIGQDEVAVIHSVVNMPFNIDASFADLAKYANEEPPPGLRAARMKFDGYLSGDLTQSLTTKSGFLKSALGDIKMTGTLAFEGIPELENFEAVLNGAIELTMTETP